jgi:hypothetical protein
MSAGDIFTAVVRLNGSNAMCATFEYKEGKGMKKKIVSVLCFGIFLLPNLTSAEARVVETGMTDDVKALVDKVIEAYGGKEAIDRVKSIFIRGKITAFMPVDEGAYTIYFKMPGKLRVHIAYQNYTEDRILNGRRGYQGNDGVPLHEVSGIRYLSIAYQYKAQDIPYGLLHNAYRLSYKGKESVNAVPVEVLGLEDEDGPSMKIYIDTKNFLIVKISGLFYVGGTETSLSSEFGDFRRLDGMEFPFTIVNYAGGQKVADTRMEEYKINTGIDDSVFEPQSPLPG